MEGVAQLVNQMYDENIEAFVDGFRDISKCIIRSSMRTYKLIYHVALSYLAPTEDSLEPTS